MDGRTQLVCLTKFRTKNKKERNMQKIAICLFALVCLAGGEAQAQRFSFSSYGYSPGVTLSFPRLGLHIDTGGNSWNGYPGHRSRQPYYSPSQWHGPSCSDHRKFYIPPVTTYPRRPRVDVPSGRGFSYHNVPQDHRQFVVPPVTTHPRRQTHDHRQFVVPPVTTFPRRPVEDHRQFVVPPVTTHQRRSSECLTPLPWDNPGIVPPQYQNGYRGFRFDEDDYKDYLEDLEDQHEDWLKQQRKVNRENEKRQREALKLQQDWHRQQLRHWNDYHR